MKRVVLVVLGIVLLLTGLAAAAAGGILWGAFGQEGVIESDAGTVRSGPDATAVVTDVLGIETEIPFGTRVGESTLVVRASDGQQVFAGYGPPDTVDDYLAGSPYYVATRTDDGNWTVVAIPGNGTPLPPSLQPFWLGSAQGESAELSVDTDGPVTLVLMNPDSSAGVDVTLTLVLRWAKAFTVALTLLIAGGVVALIGLVLLIWGARPRKEPDLLPPGIPVDSPSAYATGSPTPGVFAAAPPVPTAGTGTSVPASAVSASTVAASGAASAAPPAPGPAPAEAPAAAPAAPSSAPAVSDAETTGPIPVVAEAAAPATPPDDAPAAPSPAPAEPASQAPEPRPAEDVVAGEDVVPAEDATVLLPPVTDAPSPAAPATDVPAAESPVPEEGMAAASQPAPAAPAPAAAPTDSPADTGDTAGDATDTARDPAEPDRPPAPSA